VPTDFSVKCYTTRLSGWIRDVRGQSTKHYCNITFIYQPWNDHHPYSEIGISNTYRSGDSNFKLVSIQLRWYLARTDRNPRYEGWRYDSYLTFSPFSYSVRHIVHLSSFVSAVSESVGCSVFYKSRIVSCVSGIGQRRCGEAALRLLHPSLMFQGFWADSLCADFSKPSSIFSDFFYLCLFGAGKEKAARKRIGTHLSYTVGRTRWVSNGHLGHQQGAQPLLTNFAEFSALGWLGTTNLAGFSIFMSECISLYGKPWRSRYLCFVHPQVASMA